MYRLYRLGKNGIVITSSVIELEEKSIKYLDRFNLQIGDITLKIDEINIIDNNTCSYLRNPRTEERFYLIKKNIKSKSKKIIML